MATLLNPYLHFNGGKAKEALEFYRSIFGGDLRISTYGEFPNPSVTDDIKDQVMHGALNADSIQLMASDTGPMGDVTMGDVTMGDNISLSLSGDDEATLRGYFEGLSAGGTVGVPLEKQVWGDTFGMVTDKYGMHWMVNIAAPKE